MHDLIHRALRDVLAQDLTHTLLGFVHAAARSRTQGGSKRPVAISGCSCCASA